MANYSLIVNSRFSPFSYQEMLAPVLMATQAHQELENQYGELATKASVWEEMANEQTAPNAYKMYKTYADDLEKQAGQLAREGLNATSRRNMLNMRTRYAKEITPIARASEAFDKAEAFRADVKAKNPNAVFEIDRYNSIDDFLGGKRANNTYWDGDAAMKRVAAKAEALGRSLYSNPTAKLFLNGQQYQVSQMNGISPDELTQILLSPENINTEAGKQMRRIIDDELGSVDISKYSNEGQARINNIIATGMYAGLARPTYNYVANGEYMSKAERAANSARWASINLDREKFNYAKKQDRISSGQEPYHIDKAGNKYYRAGDAYWVVDKDGNRSATTYTKKTYDEGGNSSEESEEESKEKKKFSYMDFVVDDDTFEVGDGFDVSDAKPAEVSILNNYQRGELNKRLREKSLNLEDVSLYIDKDIFSNDHVRVVLKGADVYGVPSDTPYINPNENASKVGGFKKKK